MTTVVGMKIHWVSGQGKHLGQEKGQGCGREVILAVEMQLGAVQVSAVAHPAPELYQSPFSQHPHGIYTVASPGTENSVYSNLLSCAHFVFASFSCQRTAGA